MLCLITQIAIHATQRILVFKLWECISIPLLQLTYYCLFFFYIFDCLSQFCAFHVSDARCKGLIFVHTLFFFFVLGLLLMHYPTYFFFRNFLYLLSFFKLSFCCYVTYMCICSALSCLIMFREIADPHPHVYFRILFHVRVFGMMAIEHEDSRIYDTYD